MDHENYIYNKLIPGGFYSKKFPIAADSYFLLRACQAAVSREELDFTAGEIGLNGVSATDWAGSATELFRVQLLCGHNLFLQYFLATQPSFVQ